MLARRTNPNVHIDRIIAELSSDQDSYEYQLNELEEVAKKVIAEQGIPLGSVSVQTLTDETKTFTDRGFKAMSALISIRLLREWERDAVEAGPASAKTFYHIAHNTMIASMAAALVSPMVSDFEAEEIKTSKRQKKGGEARQRPFKIKTEIIRTELMRLWSDGARFSMLITWSNAVVLARPELTPSTDKAWAGLNRRISKLGKETFGEEWPI